MYNTKSRHLMLTRPRGKFLYRVYKATIDYIGLNGEAKVHTYIDMINLEHKHNR